MNIVQIVALKKFNIIKDYELKVIKNYVHKANNKSEKEYLSRMIDNVHHLSKYNNKNIKLKNIHPSINNGTQQDILIENEITKITKRSFFTLTREQIPRIDLYISDTFNVNTGSLQPITIVVDATTHGKPEHIILNNRLCIRVDSTQLIDDSILKIAAEDSDCLMLRLDLVSKDIDLLECLKKNRSRFPIEHDSSSPLSLFAVIVRHL
jgi:hypothetical protein